MSEIPERIVPGSADWEHYYYEHSQRYEFFADQCKEKTVLDAACGVGYGSQLLAKAGAKRVLGVDISEEAIQLAKSQFNGEKVSFEPADVTHLHVPNDSFDVAVSFETLEHIAKPEAFVKELKRVLKPNGLLIISTPNSQFGNKSQTANPYHLSELTFNQFKLLINQYFQIEQIYAHSHTPAYLRHLQLLEHLNQLDRMVRYSPFIKLENTLRRWLGRWHSQLPNFPAGLGNVLPGDFEIKPINEGLPEHLTFIIKATKK